MQWYYKLLARRPQLVLVAVGIFSMACIIVALFTRKLPDFDDPTLGFEARGTSIGKRWTAWRNLLEETSSAGRLVANPKELTLGTNNLLPKRFPGADAIRKRRKNKSKKKTSNAVIDGEATQKKLPKYSNKNIRMLKELYHNQSVTNGEIVSFEEYDNETMAHRSGRQEVWEYGRNQSYYTEEIGNKTMEKKRAKWDTLRKLKPPPEPIETHIPSDGFFCESPNKEYAHLVVQRINHNLNDSMFELNAFLALCELEQKIVKVEHYGDICQRELTSDDCCRPWSIVNYVTFLSNKSSCFELNEEDVAMVKTLLYDCFQYYHNMKLSNDCMRSSCIAPSECKQHNAVYNILHYLANVDFIRQNESAEFLNTTMIFLPIARSIKSMEFYHSLSQVNLDNDLVSVVAMDMGLKNALFDECLLRDGWLIGLGGIFVVICMWLYTGSLFVTLMTVVAVAFSLGIAYFIYSFIFELTFFPFMNLLAVIVVVGIGADDAFIFLKIWQCTIADRMKCGVGIVIPIVPSTSSCNSEGSGAAARAACSDTLVEIMGSTLRHAALSMLVTSLTTAAAFYASYVSSITAVRCFGIFSGTAVMANYFLMVTWLPAAVSIAERISCLMLLKPFARVTHRCTLPFVSIAHISRRIEDAIIDLIITLPWLWITLLGTIGIMSGILVLHWPKLRLPDSPDFKLFISNHPFERYDSEYKDMFWFEKMYTTTETFKIPLRFVWGVLPVDRGNFLDPEQRGDLYFDESFNMSAPESQQWLLQFCRRIKNQTFYQTSYGLLLPNCFIENFISWMGRRCNDSMGEIDRTPCCEISPFPFTPDIFDLCLPESISSLYETPREFFIPGVAGPKFGRSAFLANGQQGTAPDASPHPPQTDKMVKAVVIEYESTQIFTMSYHEIDAFVRTVESWLAEQLADAPPTMANAWFISELEFFDLQDTLSTGTMVAIAMAMAVALLVLMLVTLNVLISLYAIVTVTLTILTTVAMLVLLGWKLNVLESVAVSTAIGLAVDFSLHYGVHYRLSTEPDRRSSTRFSLQRMLGPTAMAAITTGIAGALMLPSSVLAYIQIGVFLVIVMSISWLYATFFLMSLLRVAGPQYGFGQFRYPKLRTGLRGSGGDGCKVTTQLEAGGSSRISHHHFHTSSHHHHHHHHHHQGVVTEQLLSNSSSAAGDLVGSESHELDSLTSNSIIKPIGLDIARPINFDRAFKKKYSLPREQSPSTASAITMVLPDDIDTKGASHQSGVQ
ncbi:protein dispatched [Anopheles stephensi]|uniref:protein dispatched n=1 Tax=Anopheles stephensi TaxID=30069 RepID=UPI0007D151B1|nr:protein dispatched [Anopheles stephensi]XP_035891596.1 protein dispatched [Anopheles stephensi]XP_035891597.1 protein dispatched [Anopheles stephensi]XP_035891598.1 protein dispatched [Anopheles stephensi]XP_035891599.1 protein dispatched [Anopheles stephensi]